MIMQSGKPHMRDMGFEIRTTPPEASTEGWTDALISQNHEICNFFQILAAADGELSEDERYALASLLSIYNDWLHLALLSGLRGLLQRQKVFGFGPIKTFHMRVTSAAPRVKIRSGRLMDGCCTCCWKGGSAILKRHRCGRLWGSAFRTTSEPEKRSDLTLASSVWLGRSRSSV